MSNTSNTKEQGPEVPIFLRKTYHMVDTCDPTIACWSEDGETFVVKDPTLFETTIIPQFFKHSKFSSFVRQLNFYSFRKIKYIDSIKIDPKLEEETANYWRFKHENFRRGHPELLTEIKRMNGHKGSAATTTNSSVNNNNNNNTNTSKEIPNEILSSEIEKPSEEVQSLRQKIEEMTKKFDQLTQIVQKVSLKQEEQEKIVDERLQSLPELKRKKTSLEERAESSPDRAISSAEIRTPELYSNMDIQTPNPDDVLSGLDMDLDDLVLPTGSIPVEEKFSLSRETSVTSDVTDSEFVDQLFTAFNSGETDDLPFSLDSSLMSSDPIIMPPLESIETQSKSDNNQNRPDPELMRRLGDALMLLPREIQEMIVNRLIAAITSTDDLENVASKAVRVVEETSHSTVSVVAEEKIETTPEPVPQKVSEPLAAATLAALLRHYAQQGHGKCEQKNVTKAIPVIPVHA